MAPYPTPRQTEALREIAAGPPPTMQALGDELGVTRAAASQLVAALVAGEWVARGKGGLVVTRTGREWLAVAPRDLRGGR